MASPLTAGTQGALSQPQHSCGGVLLGSETSTQSAGDDTTLGATHGPMEQSWVDKYGQMTSKKEVLSGPNDETKIISSQQT